MKKECMAVLALIILSVFVTGCSSHIASDSVSSSSEFVSTASEEAVPIINSDKFVLQSGEFELNAVYTYINDGEKHPAVLLIAGSGPSDCDSTLGSLKPLADIAEALAKEGICSLRVDKRTLNYAAVFDKGGVEEEYLKDCRNAIGYLKKQSAVGKIYLLGHSQGGQIASILQDETDDIAGTIFFNSSLRHLAEIACDQYIRADAANEAQYKQYAQMAKAVTAEESRGLYFYGAQDYYWASYNRYNFAELIKKSQKPMLVINSTNDLQSFEADITLWASTLENKENATVVVDKTISHLGYEIDLSDPNALTKEADFPQRIIDSFANFINKA